MAGRYVIDTNWLADAAPNEFLARSLANIAVISEMTLLKVHKDAAALNGRKLLQTLCALPHQAIVLRGTHDLYRDSGVSKGLCNRLIGPVQTADFSAYCRSVIDVSEE